MDELGENTVRHIETTVASLRAGDRFWWDRADLFTKEPIYVESIRREVNVPQGNTRYLVNQTNWCNPDVPVILRYDRRRART